MNVLHLFLDAVKSNWRAGGILKKLIYLGNYDLGFIQSNNIKIKSENSQACQSWGIVLQPGLKSIT